MKFEKVFQTDKLSKRQRAELTLKHQPVDRVALFEQLSYNPGVISMYTGKTFDGFTYTMDDICLAIRRSLDMCMPPRPVDCRGRRTTEDGFTIESLNWHEAIVGRPFGDEKGARDWVLQRTKQLRECGFSPAQCLEDHRNRMSDLQRKLNDTVITNFCYTGMMSLYHSMGLEIFSYFYADYPEVMCEFMKESVERELHRIHTVADSDVNPAVIFGEEFATKQGLLFGPEFCMLHQYAPLKKLTEAWHEHGVAVIFASGGNYKKAIPDMIDCGVDGFYCLEPACGMDIVELKSAYPNMVWAGGVDGVDLMERGTPEQVKAEVRRHVCETNALQAGGMFVGSSSEINPTIKPENYRAMVEGTGELLNADFQP
ncbi:MAG: hypothetical protein HQ546_01885 [Planctomycetes bacterium]|nr:hypothetical protein [Planctomycetota bacterium]